jgi:nucleotide-binding universal stress UspA family protein
MGVENQQRERSTPARLTVAVVGLDGSESSRAALRWAVAQVGPAGRVHAAHVVPVDDRPLAGGPDAALVVAERDDELLDRWIADAELGPDAARVEPVVRAGDVADQLVQVAHDAGAGAIVVGHHAQDRFGPRVVGHVTASLLHVSERPVVVVPVDWTPDRTDGRAVAVGVGVAGATEAALHWALAQEDAIRAGLLLAHAYGPRSVFRPDGWLDVLAYYLDPTVLPDWVEEDMLELADRLRDEAGVDVEVSVSVESGRTGARLVEAGSDASMLVVGRGEPPFVRSHALATYLRHAIVHAPCPVVVVPADDR